MRRWAIIAGIVLALVVAGIYVARAKVERYIADRLEAQRTAIQAETHELRAGIAAERQQLDAEKQAAKEAKAEADQLKAKAAMLTQEALDLLAQLKRTEAARWQAREDVAHVPDAELDSRIRARLAALRAGAPRPGR